MMEDYDKDRWNIRLDGRNYTRQYTFKSKPDAKKKQASLKASGWPSVRVIPYAKRVKGKRTVVHVVYTLID